MPDLKLIALDAEDLAVVSAHLQDAILVLGDAAFRKSERRFVMVANRFDWQGAGARSVATGQAFERRRCGVRFENVTSVKALGLDLKDRTTPLELLAIAWEPEAEGPDGALLLHFSGGGIIRLAVDCIECELRDLGAAWAAKSKPRHPEAAGPADDDKTPQ